jgi:uncharacterized protein (TIGR02118 family)
MPKVVILIKRKDHLTHEQFRTYYENNHVPLVKSQIGNFLSHYTRTYLTSPIPLTGTPGQTDFNFDVLTEIRQPDQASLEAMFAAASKPEAARLIAEDEEKFVNRAAVRMFIVEEYS